MHLTRKERVFQDKLLHIKKIKKDRIKAKLKLENKRLKKTTDGTPWTK